MNFDILYLNYYQLNLVMPNNISDEGFLIMVLQTTISENDIDYSITRKLTKKNNKKHSFYIKLF